MVQLRPFLVGPTASVRDVIACIDRNASGIALVVDDEQRLLAAVTDGDVRRGMLVGLSLDADVMTLVEHESGGSPKVPVTAPLGTTDDALLHLMNERSLRHIPLVDEDGRVVDVALMTNLVKDYELPLKAVVMAGGFGTRLGALTRELPKPMLPMGDRPLLELIVDQLRQSGVRRVAMTTHFKSDVIAKHFGDGQDFGVDIEYVPEDEPLGTAGGLALLPDSDEPLLVMNGDVLTNVDFRALLDFHREHGAAMTLCARQETVELPYGVIEADAEVVMGIAEKPTLSHMVNAGIYVIDPVARPHIARGDRLDMPQLVERLLADGQRVVVFPVREYWADIGYVETYEQAARDHAEGRLER